MNFLIDTHSHVYYDQYKDDLSSVINSAKEEGVERIICVGTDIKTSYESIEISNKYSIALHPSHIFYWNKISVPDFISLLEWLEVGIWRGSSDKGKLVLPWEESVRKKYFSGICDWPVVND